MPTKINGGAMLYIQAGHGTEYLRDAVRDGRDGYYVNATNVLGEPNGRWWGAGTAALGLEPGSEVDHDAMRGLYEHFLDPRDPRFTQEDQWSVTDTLGTRSRRFVSAEEAYARYLTAEPDAGPERQVELHRQADRQARQNVSFYDVTFSPPKSVTILHTAFERAENDARAAGDEVAAAAWAEHRIAVEEAIWAGWRAAIDYLQEHAGYTRVGHHGGAGGRWMDAHQLVASGWFQHDSRDHDPQLHIHGPVLNRVPGTDGVWRALDGKSLMRHKFAAGAVAERTTEERLQATVPVVMRMRPDGKAREVVGIPAAVNDLFSSRRRAITPKTAALVDAFRDRFGRDPNSLERVRLARQATLATRRAKEHEGKPRGEWLDEWDGKLRAEVAGGLTAVANRVVNADRETGAVAFDADAVVETALAQVQAERASWTRSDLMRAINSALPDRLGDLAGGQVPQLLDGLTDAAITRHGVLVDPAWPGDDTLPPELLLANGASSYVPPGSVKYTTTPQLHAEQMLRAATVKVTTARLSTEQAQAFLTGLREQGVEPGADQEAAVRGVLTDGAGTASLVGPAGTGKSFTVGLIAHAWEDRTLWGEQHRVFGLAASQRATETLAGDGVAHARNITRWLRTQDRLASGHPIADDHEWRLQAGDLVVVDEAATGDTASLVRIHRIMDEHGGKLLLTGDHRQLAAVGAAGGMDLAAAAGRSYELVEARRFVLPWERAASLRLREHDPAGLDAYQRHGRLHDSGTVEQAEAAAVEAWLADTLRGKNSLLIADTNEQAARLSDAARARLVRLGQVEEVGVELDRDRQRAGVGDVVAARRNAWELSGWQGNRRPPINRDRYRVTETHPDGSLTVDTLDGLERLRLPASYVRQHVSLGYASTVHSAQSLTVDTGHIVATERTRPEAFYVGMSRGTQANTAHVVTISARDDMPPGLVARSVHRNPRSVLADGAERAEEELSATAETETLAEQAGTLRAAQERFTAAADVWTAGRTRTWLDRLADDGLITAADRRAAAADNTMTGLVNILRRAEVAGHDPEQVLRAAAARRSLSDARSIPSVLHSRIAEQVDLTPRGSKFADWVPGGTDRVWARHFADLAAAADARHGTAVEAAWLLSDTDQPERPSGAEKSTTELPPAPAPAKVEQYAMWRAAWTEQGRPEITRAESEMSDGQLRMRVRALRREENWAPPFVGPKLSGTHQAAAKAKAESAIRAADGDRAAADVAETRARMLAERAAQLEVADEARTTWWAHTAGTREAAQRARLALFARGVDPDRLDRPVTGRQWLADQQTGQQVEEQHRDVVNEDELARHRPAHDHAAIRVETPPAAEAASPDIRQVAAPIEDKRHDGNWERVADADETAAAVDRARDALREIAHRHTSDHLAEQSDRDRLTAQWAVEDEELLRDRGDVAERIPSIA